MKYRKKTWASLKLSPLLHGLTSRAIICAAILILAVLIQGAGADEIPPVDQKPDAGQKPNAGQKVPVEKKPSIPRKQSSSKKKASAPERTGYVIHTIKIDAQNVFDPDNSDEDGFIGKFGNRIHIVTKEQVVRWELLFKEGDTYDQGIINESQRNLRKRSYLTEVIIESTFNDKDKNVDIVVHSRDQWTIISGVTYGGTSENPNAGFDLGDKNLLGMGQSLNYSFRTANSGYSHDYGYRNNNLVGSRYDLWVEHATKPDQNFSNIQLNQPFYSLSTINAHEIGYSQTLHSELALNWKTWRSSAFYGHAFLLDDLIIRTYLRLSIGEEVSTDITGSSTSSRDNKIAVSADFLDDPKDFEEERYIDKFHVIEDIPLGTTYTVLAGPRLIEFGSTTSDITAAAGVSKWIQLFDYDYLFLSAAWAKNDDKFNDVYADFTARYYLRYFEYHSFAARFETSYSESNSNRFRLGGTNGLRGYKVDEFVGQNQILINLEDRIFTYQTFLSGIFEPGFVIFTDFGNTGNNFSWDKLTHLNGSYGVGLRLALVKAPGISLIRVDWGIPFDSNRDSVITIGMEGFF